MYTTGTLDNQRIARLAHSYAARIMALSARTAEERAALDWNQILSHVNQGITSDFRVDLEAESGWRSSYLLYAQRDGSTRMYADYKLIGPGDVSGNYQDWIAADFSDRDKFLITTPDRRITGETPESDGKYFRYRESDPFDAAQGPYFGSFYQYYRNNGSDRIGTWGIITVDEMNLLKAEALLRTGVRAGAADLINLTRVENGELPPVTADGVTDSATCVPRDPASGACGTLLQALEHERRMELSGLDAMYTYLDRRGFDSLATGTLLHLPIPGEQLEILGIPMYTFGGNLPWSAR
jgi:hypothetical protein